MAIITDATGRQLAQAVGGIDTGGLAKDTTLQATNTALRNINSTLGGITTSDPPTDTTQQSIATAISGLGATLGSSKANISGDNIADKTTFRNNIGVTSSFLFYVDTTGTTPITLPNNWKMLIAQVVYNGVYLTSIFTYNMMTASGNAVSLGNYGTSYATGQIARTEFKITSVNWAGTNVTASSKAYLYLAY